MDSLQLNHKELAYRYPTHDFVPTVKMWFEKVRYSRTTPNLCETDKCVNCCGCGHNATKQLLPAGIKFKSVDPQAKRYLIILLSLHWKGFLEATTSPRLANVVVVTRLQGSVKVLFWLEQTDTAKTMVNIAPN